MAKVARREGLIEEIYSDDSRVTIVPSIYPPQPDWTPHTRRGDFAQPDRLPGPTAQTLLAYLFDRDGLDESNAEPLWQRLGDPVAWIDAHSEGVNWVHPRYRWVLDLEDEQSSWAYKRNIRTGQPAIPHK